MIEKTRGDGTWIVEARRAADGTSRRHNALDEERARSVAKDLESNGWTIVEVRPRREGDGFWDSGHSPDTTR
jgi:hypothetical protein